MGDGNIAGSLRMPTVVTTWVRTLRLPIAGTASGEGICP